jgi:hypothetical protein
MPQIILASHKDCHCSRGFLLIIPENIMETNMDIMKKEPESEDKYQPSMSAFQKQEDEGTR